MFVVVGNVDIFVINVGGFFSGMWFDWECEDFIKVLDFNMLILIVLMKVFLSGMMEKGWGRVVNIIS